MSDVWAAHRAAIAIEEGSDVRIALAELTRRHDNDIEKVVQFLVWHGLAGVWSEAISRYDDSVPSSQLGADPALTEIRTRLAPLYRQQIAHQLLQESVMRTVGETLKREAVTFVWLKAAAVRSELYEKPGLRPSTDLDLLVSPADRERAIQALVAAGGIRVAAAVSAHEAEVQLRSVDLDLHWDVLAPGRLRAGVVDEILRDRIPMQNGARPSNQHALALALIHPAYAKHVCSRHMGLNRVADTLRMLRTWEIDSETLVKLTKRWGGFTGAKASLYWLSKICENTSLPQVNRPFGEIADTARGRYLARQIDQNWPDQWVDRSRLVLGVTFSMWLQDTPSDALRAVFARFSRARPAK